MSPAEFPIDLPAPLRPIRLHGLAEAQAAFDAAAALGRPLVLLSPPGAGALWFRKLLETAAAARPGLSVAGVFDCGDRAGDAQGALAAGLRLLLFRGHPGAAARLADVAARVGGRVLTDLPPPLDLRGVRDPRAACRAWLSDPAEASPPAGPGA
ncbi:hypothetical protein [Azospirillum thermophilum]|uniref:Uncharacterized protein n=1 Tax=Azospirillum thermophilum TaxID=2202148 RepID=A0A2S2CME0_9PROT|nr:hypothetical protein [Azospirillum thermophilum]AWK85540.1 hypothetical protein DEW08_04590 [Azospirillum thermophilum]